MMVMLIMVVLVVKIMVLVVKIVLLVKNNGSSGENSAVGFRTCGLGCGTGGRVLHSMFAKSQSPHSPEIQGEYFHKQMLNCTNKNIHGFLTDDDTSIPGDTGGAPLLLVGAVVACAALVDCALGQQKYQDSYQQVRDHQGR